MAAKRTDMSGPFRGNGSVNTFPRKLLMQQLSCNNGKGMFLRWSVLRCNNQGTKSVLYEVCEERSWAREAEESPLLEAVVRERLVKKQQAGKGLACGVLICELRRLALALYYKWSINRVTNPNPVYIHTPSSDSIYNNNGGIADNGFTRLKSALTNITWTTGRNGLVQ
jgi:hypothetical protein